jgi:hypothetical protein
MTKVRDLAEHVRVLFEKDFRKLNDIVWPFTLKEFFSDMCLADISTIDLLLSESSHNSVILQ